MRPVAKAFVVATGLWLVSTSYQLVAQTPQTAPAAAQTPADSAAPTKKPEEGIPITDATVIKACSSCHKKYRN